jgi:hypothetical protein
MIMEANEYLGSCRCHPNLTAKRLKAQGEPIFPYKSKGEKKLMSHLEEH